MKRMRTQSVLWYLGTPGTTATRAASGAASPSAAPGGSLPASLTAAASPAPSWPGSPASHREPVARAGVACLAQSRGGAGAGESDDVGVGFPGVGRVLDVAFCGARGSCGRSRRIGGIPGGGSGVGRRAGRDVLRPGIGGGVGGNRGLALRLRVGDGGRDCFARLAALVRVVIEPGVASRPVVVFVARAGVTGSRATGSRAARSRATGSGSSAGDGAARDGGGRLAAKAVEPTRRGRTRPGADPAPGLTAGASEGAEGGDGAAHDLGAFAAARASALGTPQPSARSPGVPAGVVSCHADGARPPAPRAVLAARWSCPEVIQSGVDDDHGSRAAVVSHGGTGSAGVPRPWRRAAAGSGVLARPLPCGPRQGPHPPTTRPPWRSHRRRRRSHPPPPGTGAAVPRVRSPEPCLGFLLRFLRRGPTARDWRPHQRARVPVPPRKALRA